MLMGNIRDDYIPLSCCVYQYILNGIGAEYSMPGLVQNTIDVFQNKNAPEQKDLYFVYIFVCKREKSGMSRMSD